MFGLTKRPLAKLAECPSCACDVGVRVAVAYRQAGGQADKAGVVTECVRCGCRYTALADGRVIAFRATVRAPEAQGGGQPGGQATGGPGWLDDDMVTLPTP